MAPKKYDSFRDLKKGKYDWKVTARVMNLWRGFTKDGQPFQSFNLLLLDNMRYRIHAFVPGNIAQDVEPKLVVGNLYLFKKFNVKEYKAEDKFRCLHKDIQIVFSNDTKITDLDESDVFIEKAVFDFFELSDLNILSKQTTYLTDVIEVITTPNPTISNVRTKFGGDQKQIKFEITDGRTSVNVTFWDAFAEHLADSLDSNLETPLIIIIGCARITEWKERIQIRNVGCTTFYLNYDHYTVSHMRTLLNEPGFADVQFERKNCGIMKQCTVEQIKQLGADDAESLVLTQLRIQKVPEMEKWYGNFCTSCYDVTEMIDEEHYCMNCSIFVPHPLKWFQLCIQASDESGVIDIVLENVAAEKCIGYSVEQILKDNTENFPSILKCIAKKEVSVKLLITAYNIQQKNKFYIAKDLMEGLYSEVQMNEAEESAPKPLQESYAEPSVSSYHLESMSENN